MSFQDVFKNSFLTNFNSTQVDLSTILFGLRRICFLHIAFWREERSITKILRFRWQRWRSLLQRSS